MPEGDEASGGLSLSHWVLFLLSTRRIAPGRGWFHDSDVFAINARKAHADPLPSIGPHFEIRTLDCCVKSVA